MRAAGDRRTAGDMRAAVGMREGTLVYSYERFLHF